MCPASPGVTSLLGGPWGHGVALAPARRCPPVAGTGRVGAPGPCPSTHHGQSTWHSPGKNKIHFFYQSFNQKTLNLSGGDQNPLGHLIGSGCPIALAGAEHRARSTEMAPDWG